MWIKVLKGTGQLKSGLVYDLPSKIGRDMIAAHHGGLVPKGAPGVKLTALPTAPKTKAKTAS